MGIYDKIHPKHHFSIVSLLFSLTFFALIAIGTLIMVFDKMFGTNFTLGLLLFVLGTVLMLGNEIMFIRGLIKSENTEQTASESVASVVNFAVISYLLPLVIVVYLYLTVTKESKLLIIVIAGFVTATIKLASKTFVLFFGKKGLSQ
jgi:hypothetical protein